MTSAVHTSARGGLNKKLRAHFRALRNWVRSSLTARVVLTITAVGGLLVGVVGGVMASQVTSAIFDRAVSSNVNQFEGALKRSQARVASANAPAASELQQLANELVSAQFASSGEVTGAALIRARKQETNTSFEIAEPSTLSSTRIRTVVSDQMRTAVNSDTDSHWQSVELTLDSGETAPGMLIGSRLNLPGAGTYEFYVAYSLANEDDTLSNVLTILGFGATVLVALVALIAAVIVRLVLRPVREASRNASALAQGAFDSRMEVKGEDELAQLSRSFNKMASSLSEQFTQLERMSKVQQEFVSAVSHELRSPVTTIRMAGQLIYDKRDELPNVLRRSAELQHDQLINLDVMLSDLLEISRYDAGAMTLASQNADLANIASEAVRAQEPLAQANGVDVVIESRGDTGAQVEARRVTRILRNLVVNALEHAEGRPVRVLVVGGEDAVAVEVSDRGVGLDAEQAAHVFDRFWRADASRVRKSGGTGLGLTIAREDAMLHGGTLQCAGEIGVGATFLLTLPRKVGEPFGAPLPLRVAAAEETWGVAEAEPGEPDPLESPEQAEAPRVAEVPRVMETPRAAEESTTGVTPIISLDEIVVPGSAASPEEKRES